jgi:hypothetical protein
LLRGHHVLLNGHDRCAQDRILSRNSLGTVTLGACIPCYHKTYAKLVSGGSFSRWEVHQRWHLREPTVDDPYRRILDPHIATALSGRPKNTAQPVPGRLAIGAVIQSPGLRGTDIQLQHLAGELSARLLPDGSQAQNTPLATSIMLSQHSGSPRQLVTLGPGRTTGARMSGQRVQPNIRRQVSQWEAFVNVNEESIPPAAKTVGAATKAPPTCSRCHNIGHIRTSNICPLWY